MGDFKVSNEKIAQAISLLTNVYNNPDEKTFIKAKTLIEQAAQFKSYTVPVRADKVKKEAMEFYQSDTPWLDEWIGGGVRRKEVVLIGGIPYSGKTHLLIWLAARYAEAKIAHFYGEDLQGDVKRYYERAGGKQFLKNAWLVGMQDYAFTAKMVEQIIEQLAKEGNKPDIVVLDHVDIMGSSLFSRADWEDATGVVREVKVMAGRQDVMVFAASQLHEKSRERKGMARFYRAKIGKSSNADIILMVDDVAGNEYRMSRQKAKGRDLSSDSSEKTLDVDWSRMTVEDIT